MLKKLLKHDFKALARILLPLNLITFAFGLVAAGAGFLGFAAFEIDACSPADEIIAETMGAMAGLALVICTLLVLASTVGTFTVVAWRFYRNLFTDEGYLTLTLPATAGQLAASKIIAGLAWMLANAATVMVCLMLINLAATGFDLGFDVMDSMPVWLLKATSNRLIDSFGDPYGPFALSSLIGSAILQMLFMMLMIFASLALGAAAAKRHKIAAGVGIFIGLWAAFGMLAGTIGLMIGFANMMVDAVLSLDTSAATIALVRAENAILQVGAIAGFWALVVWVLKRKVNLP